MIPRRAALALAVLGAGCAPASVDERPDLVLVVIDSLRFDHLGCYGYAPPTSPTIDRLAAEGVRFETAVSSTSWTLPAHAALFTGLYDSGHGLVTGDLRLADGHRTLAERLAESGYQTAGFYGAPYLHPTFGLHQGFETWQSCMTAIADDADEVEVRAQAPAEDVIKGEHLTGPRTLEEVGRFLETADERPLFLFVHLWDVHYDYAPPAEYVELFDPDYEGDLDFSRFDSNPAVNARMDPRDLQHLIALYDGEIRFTDDVVADLLALLAASGRRDDAVLVVTADHGDEFFEHGGKGHQHTLYDELVRVPLVFHAPGRFPAGRVVEDQVRLIDLKPTLLALAGVAEAELVHGRDLGPLLAGGTLEAEPALCELHIHGQTDEQLRALRTNDFKVLSPVGGRVFGYDVRADPRELSRLFKADDARVEPGAGELRSRVRAAREDTLGVQELDGNVQEDVLRRLRELGYTEDPR